MDKVHDVVFGEMEYKYSWKKKQSLPFWGTILNVNIKAAAYKNQNITEEQRQSYLKFMQDLDKISETTLRIATEYISENYQGISEDKTKNVLIPRTILFKQDGSCGILCDFDLDIENGIVICIYPKQEVGPQDIFL